MVDNKCDNDQNGEHQSEVVKYVSDELPILGELRKAFTGDSTGPPPLQADENVTSLSDSIDLSSLCSVVETFGEERNSSSSLRKILGGKSDDDDEWEKVRHCDNSCSAGLLTSLLTRIMTLEGP